LRIVGTNHDYLTLYAVDFQEGEAWKIPFDVVLGVEAARQLQLGVGDTFVGSHGIASSSHEHEEHPYKVSGILEKRGTVVDQLILTSIESVWYTHDEEHDHAKLSTAVSTSGFPQTEEEREITAMLVQYGNPIAAVQLPRFINSRSALQAASPTFEISRLFELLGVGVSFVQGLAFVIIIIAGLSIFIAMYNSLKERKYDLAVMRTLGASRLQVFFHIIGEGIILTLLGAIIGIFIGHLFLHILVISNDQGSMSGLSATIFLKKELFIITYAVIIGIVAALLPAWQAYNTNISKQLTK